ncbi:TonB-dependent receptor [Sphingomonas sp. Leaf339]|uniref:TonB-dependent receptor n=1 Tax=Sphingomonas sp. Leaf339 TaxID=1736343 RepID=UPI0006FD963D|nr:TonB-dependent receptor [Sphingomonas sp. Leaf339]KQU49803.1 TonB-dependent receptor [Sphingomonas sp. Leaf339]
MNRQFHGNGKSLFGAVSLLALGFGIAPTVAVAQTAVPSATTVEPQTSGPVTPSSDTATGTATPVAPGEEADIVVTGFRASLNSAINLKRNETAAVDSIVAEDIGKFPDSNLAESMQRIPGVALSRGDGGEGKNISVRGLGAGFTRVRINGMEGTSQTGASDIYGAGNSGRSFDFNAFPTEIFAALAVRKTPSADIEEGSLGATVDLKAPHPLDFKTDFVITATARGIYNEVAKKVDPRASILVAKQFANGTLGVLGSFAYGKRNLREVGYSAVNILPAYIDGGFCSPVGYAPQNPATNATRGTNAANCSTNNPRTSTTAAYNTIQNLRGITNQPGGGAFFPRIPRYVNSEQDAERLGGTLTLQWKPDDNTDISIDGLYSRFDVERRDNYIGAISFGRTATNGGKPMTSVRDIQFDQNGSLQYGVFDGVDVRSEGLVDRFVSTFKQVNLNVEHRFSDSFKFTGLAGISNSRFYSPLRLQTFMDVINANGFTIDFRDGGNIPKIGFGVDVANPANFSYAPSPDGNFTVLGGFSTAGRPLTQNTRNKTFEGNLEWNVTDNFAFKAGGQFRESNLQITGNNLIPSQVAVRALPAGTTLASITRQITNFGKLLGDGSPAEFSAIDPDKWKQAVGFDSFQYCGVECGAQRSGVRERIKSGYLMATFNTEDILPIPIRGDMGVRYVHTDQDSFGFIPVVAPAGSTYPTVGRRGDVSRSYEDWLPSINIVGELRSDLLLRLSAASVLSRPELGQLTPTSGVTVATRTGSVNNPFLDPIRANTLDAALEWYFAPGSLLSVAYFHKNIGSYIQSISSQVPYSSLGLPDELLAGTPSTPADLFTVNRSANTPGGSLNGVEVNAQLQLRFLPGFLSNLGVLGSYTYVKSKINYILASANGVPTQTTTDDLIDLSKNSASGTLYYEDKRFSIRSTASYRSSFNRGIPSGANDSDVRANASTLFVDASASYNLTDNFKLIIEAQNLTDERNTLYIDSTRKDTLFETRLGRTFNVGATVKF